MSASERVAPMAACWNAYCELLAVLLALSVVIWVVGAPLLSASFQVKDSNGLRGRISPAFGHPSTGRGVTALLTGLYPG